MTFRLNIKLGNDAMCVPADVAHALKKIAVEDLRFIDAFETGTHKIMDANGNTVGEWKVGR